jgi:hypothetical protein
MEASAQEVIVKPAARIASSNSELIDATNASSSSVHPVADGIITAVATSILKQKNIEGADKFRKSPCSQLVLLFYAGTARLGETPARAVAGFSWGCSGPFCVFSTDSDSPGQVMVLVGI